MGLAERIAAKEHKVTMACYIDGKPVKITRFTVDHGYDSVSAAVTVTLQKLYDWVQFAKQITLFVGWDGYTRQIARALIQAKRPGWWPLTNEVTAAGYLSRAQKPYGGTITYASQSDTAIVNDLLSKSNVPFMDIQGAGVTLATLADYEIGEGSTPWSAIEEVDKVSGYKTFDSPPDGTVRRRLINPGQPTAGYAFSFEEGVNETNIRRVQTIEQLYNRVYVSGLAGEGIYTARRADSPYVDRDYTFPVNSELIQTQAISDDVALKKMLEVNRVADTLDITTPLDPRVQPGMTVRVKNPAIGITSWTNYWVKHVNHSGDAASAWSHLTVEGGTGEAGYVEPKPPEAMFEYVITQEQFDVGGTSTQMYTVMCDAALSYDPDGTITAYAWSNNKNADVGGVILYSTAFTAGEMAGSILPAITLAVTDSQSLSGTITQEIDAAVEIVTMRELYVAASARAEATPDGGVTWNTWTPASGTVTATPEIAAEGLGLFGCSTGKLMYTEDYLATAPTEMHDFGSQINAIWVNEVDADRVVVGLQNGQVYATADASARASATWTLLYVFGSPVLWIAESPYHFGQYFLACGAAFWTTSDSFATVAAWISWASGTARKAVLSDFAHYGCGTFDAPVKNSDGTTVDFPVVDPVVNDVRTITHHIRDDVLYAADVNATDGTTARFWKKAAGVAVFTALLDVANAGRPNCMVRDGDNQLVVYIATDEGLYKTFNGFTSVARVRDYSGAGLDGLMVGYGSAPWLPITAVTVVSDATAKAKTLWNGTGNDAPPDGWRNIAFDDSAWAAAAIANKSPGQSVVVGTQPIWSSANELSNTEQCMVRHTFAVDAGVATSVTLTARIDDNGLFYLNNVFIGPTNGHWETEDVWTIDPAIILPGQNNVLAVHGFNDLADRAWISYKLEVS